MITKQVKNLHKLFDTELTKNGIKVLANSARHEFHLRADIGEMYNQVLNDIIPCKITDSNLSLTQKYSTQVITTTKAGSNIPKGTQIYFVNTGKISNGILKTKMLTPDALGFAGKTYDSKSLYKSLIESLDRIDIRVRGVIHDLIMCSLNNTGKINTFGISQPDVNIIAKDYGELTGALYAMNHHFKDVKSVTFPLASNAALVDYYLKTNDGSLINISAKSSGGAAPSLTSVSALISEGLIDIKSGETAAADFILDVKKLSGMDAIDVFSKRFNTPGYKELIKINGSYAGHAQFEKYVSSMTFDQVKQKFGSVWEVMNRFPREDNAKKLFSTSGKKAGVILSPLGYHLIDIINKDKVFVDFLNKALNSLNTQQIYLDIKKDSAKYTVKEFKQSKFLYHFDSNIAKPDNKKISFKMIK